MLEIMFLSITFSIILIFIFRSKKMNSSLLLINSVIYFLMSVILFFKNNSDSVTLAENFMKNTGIMAVPSYFFSQYFGIDSLNIIFLLILGLLFLGVSIYNIGFTRHSGQPAGRLSFYTMFFLLFVFSMTGVIMSTHLALLWVFVEATTLTSAYLIYFEKTKASLEAAWKYIFICSIGIALAFVGIILLSIGLEDFNSLYFADLYKEAKSINPFWLKFSFAFIMVGFGTKMGLAPVHAWLPDAHSEAPSPVSALLSGTLLNIVFLGILRVYKIMEIAGLVSFIRILLMSMGFLSLLVCSVFVIKIKNYKRLLAYSSIENMGIIAAGIGVGGICIYAAIMHLVFHSLVKSGFFLTSGNIHKLYKTKNIDNVRGLLKKDGITGWLWILSFICISGIPPFPVFLSEFLIIRGMFEEGLVIPACFFLLLLTIIMSGFAIFVLRMCFGEPDNEGLRHEKLNFSNYLPQALILILLLMLGIYIPEFINSIIQNAASAL